MAITFNYYAYIDFHLILSDIKMFGYNYKYLYPFYSKPIEL